MKRFALCFFVLAGSALFSAPALDAAPWIVEDGQPRAEIVVAEEPARAAEFGACEQIVINPGAPSSTWTGPCGCLRHTTGLPRREWPHTWARNIGSWSFACQSRPRMKTRFTK